MHSFIVLFLLLAIFCIVNASSSTTTKASNVKSCDKKKENWKLGFASTRGLGLSLCGEGTRSKGPIKVYTVALYFDKNAIVNAVKKLKGKKGSELASSRDFENAIINGNIGRHIVLKMARNVSGTTMAGAIADSVKPRMKGKDSTQLKDFQNILISSLKDGAKSGMTLSFEGTSSLTVKINGNKKGEVKSPTLCKAFLDVYVGKDCVSSSLKSSLANTVASWL